MRREQQRGRLDVAGVEERDDADGNQIVHHGQGEQEDAQGAGQVRADNCQHGHGKRDVRGRGDGPAAQGFRAVYVHCGIDQGRDKHAAGGGRDGHDRFAELPQVARHELALEFQAHQEEEDGQEAVGGPGAQAEFEVPRFVADPEVPQGEVAVGEG